jgi:hypothetical protein
MRRLTIASLAILAAAGGLVACATVEQPFVRSPAAAAELARYLDGRVPGKPESCVTSLRADDMITIDEHTILFRDGFNRIWRNELNGPCNGLGRPGYALLTKRTSPSLCRGDIAQVIDTAGGFTVGSCSFGDFVPYVGPMRR